MQQIKEFFGNYMLMSAICGWLGAQIIKVFTGMFKERSFNIATLLFSTGGMPSSHAAAVVALATAAGLSQGFGSPIFAVCGVLSVIVMIDASGVRYETGRQAKILNKLIVELFSPENTPKEFNTKLKELVGHTPIQVAMGAVFGVLAAIILAIFMVW
jgi:acid phosphatase family membrane protein YuiD